MPIVILPIRPRRLRIALILGGLGATAAIAAGLAMPEARADGNISHAEAVYIVDNHDAVCATLDKYPTIDGVVGVMEGIEQDGWAGDSAVDIINATVSIYCDAHWPLLVAIGEQARASHAGAISSVVKA
jgi:hypothetical protein